MYNLRCSMRSAAAAVLLALTLAVPARAQVTAVITADNAYRLGYGPANPTPSNPVTWLNTVENTTAGDIFNCAGGPETYSNLNPGVADYLYVVAYGDDGGYNGFLGRFSLVGGRTVSTGDPAWRVRATRRDVDLNLGGVANNVADAAIAAANPNGWQGVGTPGLAMGELNNSNSTTPVGNQPPPIFPIICNIPPSARWMWYQSQAGVDAFRQNPPGGGGHNEFLIFRLPVRALLCPCARGIDRDNTMREGVDRGRDLTVDSLTRRDAEPPGPAVRPARPQH